MQKAWILYLFTLLFSVVQAEDAWDKYTCDKDTKCPESRPCCSQYGVCGTGSYCLGGCDIRYSYNLTACMPMPVFADYENDFSNSSIIKKQTSYLGHADETDWVYTGYLDENDDAILLQMPNQSTGTVVSSTKYIWYGKVSARIKSSRDRGVITAFILFSDVQDEIDHEFVGYNLTNPQTNYYAQGILDYDNADNSTVSNTYKNYHDYEFDWREDRIDWYIDNEKVRTLFKNETYNKTTDRYDYPQTPARVQFSLWPGGDTSNSHGTIEWAGGEINWDSTDIEKYGYYYAYVKDVKVEPYGLPDDIAEIESEDGLDDFKAFMYNSTDGNEDDIYLTNKKYWLGSDDATGIDPDNEDDDGNEETTETLVETSGSVVKTKTTKSTKSHSTSVAVPGKTNTGTAAATTTYNASAGIGGFVQNSEETDSSTGASKNEVAATSYGGLVGLLAMAVGALLY